MAKVIKHHQFSKSPKGDYPWDKWLDGRQWQLTRGEDFYATVVSFRTVAYRAAQQRGMRLRSDTEGDTIIIQAINQDEDL